MKYVFQDCAFKAPLKIRIMQKAMIVFTLKTLDNLFFIFFTLKIICNYLFRKEKYHLSEQLPVRTNIRLYCIVSCTAN